jgi:hypothetical protein
MQRQNVIKWESVDYVQITEIFPFRKKIRPAMTGGQIKK